MDIQQGNIITLAQEQQIHLGMTSEEVKNILGTPLLLNTFGPQQINYIYTFKPGGCKMMEKYINLTFKSNKLTQINQNLDVNSSFLSLSNRQR